MSLDQIVEQIKNIFQGRGQPQTAQPPFTVLPAQNETQQVPEAEAVAAIAAAIYLYEKTESAANTDSEIAAAIAASLHLHLTSSDAAYGSDKKSETQSPWSQYGRGQVQNARFQIFNRPVPSEKSILIRHR